MTPDEVLKISEPVEQIYNDCTSQLIINISRHFKTGKALATREWEIQKLSELGKLTEESIEIIAKNTGQTPEAIRKAMREAVTTALTPEEKALQAAVGKGLIQAPATSMVASEGIRSVVKNLSDQAIEDTNIVNTVMLQSTRNRYLQAINYCITEEQKEIERLQSVTNLAELDKQLEKTQRALNEATMSVATGAEARTAALRRTVKKLADEGITGFIDAGGHNWSPEAYVNMDIRTTVHNAAIQAQKARSAEYNVSTFQVSSHAGARPLCAPYQGKFYSWDNTSGVIHDLDGRRYRYDGIDTTSYGEAAGLFGINCGHYPQTFIDGYSIPRYEQTQNEEENARIYKESQTQRSYERGIRKAKTEALAYKAAGDEEAYTKAVAKVQNKNKQYKDYCNSIGRQPRTDRLYVNGYTRSDAAKGVQAAKLYPAKPSKLAPVGETATGKALLKELKDANIDYKAVKDLAQALTEQEIIDRLGGGDMTQGSCASLAFSYMGNRNGLDVLDFRGGDSRSYFAKRSHELKIAQLDGVKSTIVESANDFTAVHKLMKKCEEGKEYMLTTGRHAAIIRQTGGNFEYLELQSATRNGFHPLNDDVLKWRFACKKSHTWYGAKMEWPNLLIDAESLKDNEDFKGILGYINTNKSDQLKSVHGSIK